MPPPDITCRSPAASDRPDFESGKQIGAQPERATIKVCAVRMDGVFGKKEKVQWERAVEVLSSEGHFGRAAKLLKSAA